MEKFNLTTEEFLSLYDGANRGVCYDRCIELIEQIFDMPSVMSLTFAECLLQFREFVNANKPELKVVMDQLHSEFQIPKSNDPNFKSVLDAYISKAKELLKDKKLEIEHIDYKSNVHSI